jgi:hypothetical protein
MNFKRNDGICCLISRLEFEVNGHCIVQKVGVFKKRAYRLLERQKNGPTGHKTRCDQTENSSSF